MYPPSDTTVETNIQIEHDLESLPDKVADLLLLWRKASLEREKAEALLYLKFKGEDKELTATEIRAMVHSDDGRYIAMMEEIKAESLYTRYYEKLLSAKKLSSLRTAF